MPNFALKEIEEIKGKLRLFKMLVDGSCLYDDFESEIEREGNFVGELRVIETRLHVIADCLTLPKTKFKDITPKKGQNKEYEIKTKHLRVYLFHDKGTGRIIVCGGKKGTQRSDINRFRTIMAEYLKNTKQSC